MPVLNTARGAIGVDDLGVTLMHEHVFIMTTEIMENYPEGWGDGARREADAIARLDELKSRGVDTIVDLTVVGLGRYIPRIARIAAATELNIVVATGLYTYNDVPMYFHYLGPGAALGGPETMVDMFVRDIEHGIADTGVKAAILKCATDEPGVTPGVERVLRAVAQAHRADRRAHLHAHPRRDPAGSGAAADLRRGGRRPEPRRHRPQRRHHRHRLPRGAHRRRLLPRAWTASASTRSSSIEERVKTVATMCERGHAERMVLSHDASCYFDALPEETLPVALPNWHYLHIPDDVIPALKERGVTDEQLTTMLVDNPRRIFGTTGGY